MKRSGAVVAIVLLGMYIAGCGQDRPTAVAVPAVPPTATAMPIPSATSLPVTASSAAQELRTATRTPRSIAQEIDIYLNSLTETNSFTGAVLVARDNQIILSEGYGFSNRDQNIPNTSHTRFRICSITKQFTAMGILILQDQGKLSVDTRICDFLPQCPTAWRAITVHHLLTHTSGIPDFTDLPDYESTKSLPSSPLQTIARFQDMPLQFEPGDRWSYSNSGYIILGYLIEQVSGQPYDDFIQGNIFSPLQMNDSGYDHNLDIIATGYTGIGSQWAEAHYIDMSIPYSAGALYSTVEDMYRWDQALYTERLIPQKLLDKMFTPYASSPIGDFGYGWIVSEKHLRPVIRHGGGGDGFVALIERYPNDRVTLIALSNRETTDIGMITDAIAEMVFGE